ncbi:MAG: hypothetical protein II992_02770, partial [Lachnospiraceae bacterium]|nr:hypothetical protein [Lachnospiraceae bacterium]
MNIKIKLHSMRFRLTCVLSALIFGTFFLCWLTNQMFLPIYYQYSKINTLKETYVKVYEELNKMEEQGKNKEELELSLEKWRADNNLSIYVMDWSRVYQGGTWNYLGEFVYPEREILNEMERKQVLTQMGKSIGLLREEQFNVSISHLYENDVYDIVKMKDERLNSQYLELMGNIDIGDSNHTIYVRTNYESIQESVQLSSQFLIFAGLIATIVGIISMLVISGNFTKPIRKLSYMAREMSELKFETKYMESRKDEIGDL